MADKESKDSKKKRFHRKDSDQQLILPKSFADKQRLQIDKLMRNPEKPVYIPERPKDWKTREPPEFVRDVMGSSAGAGSGEFHVYRGYRRREYARQMHIHKKAEQEEQMTEFQKKVEENETKAEERTIKNRNKRMKKKQKMLQKKKQKVEELERENADEQKNADKEGNSDAGDGDDDDNDDGDVEENCFVIGGR